MVTFPIDIKLETGQVVRGSAQVRRELDGINRSAQGIGQTFQRLQSVIAGAFAVGAIARFGQQFAGFIATYEQALSTVEAVTGATARETRLLNEEFQDLGRTTRFTATQAAEGALALGRAGFDTNEILGSLEQTLLLAQAGALDLGSAADITTNVLSGFGLAVEETGRVADVLALGANSANTSVEQLGQAMSFVAPIANELGISLEEATAAVGILSDRGVQGTRAATGLRGAIAALQAPSDAAAQALDDMNISLEQVDLQGETLTEVFELLGERGITTAEAFEIFGRESATAALILSDTSEEISILQGELDNAEGSAARISDTMNDNLQGAIDQTGSAVQGFGLALDEATGFSDALQVSLIALSGVLNTVTDQLQRFARVRRTLGQLLTSTPEESTETLLQFGLENFIQGTEEALFGTLENILPAAPIPVAPPAGGDRPRATSGGGGGGGSSALERAARDAERLAERQAEINRRALEGAEIRREDLELARRLLDAQIQEQDFVVARIRSEERLLSIRRDSARAAKDVTDETVLSLIQQNELVAIATEQIRLEAELEQIFRRQQEAQAEIFEERLNLLNELTETSITTQLEETTTVAETLGQTFEGLGSAIREAFTGGEDAMNRFFDSLLDRLLDQLLNTAINQLFGLIGGGAVGGPFTQLGFAGGGPFSGFTSSLGGAFSGGGAAVLGNFSILGEGGIVTRPTAAVLGDSGTEAVIPLDRFMGGARPTQTINLTIEDSNGNRTQTQVPSNADIEILIDRTNERLFNDPRSRTNRGLNASLNGGR